MILGLHGVLGRHDLAKAVGASHVRLVVREPFENAHFEQAVKELNQQFAACKEHDLSLVVTLALEDRQTKTFYTNLEKLARRFPEITYWQIGNEVSRQWRTTDAAWIDTFKRGSSAVRSGNPKAWVITSAITGSLTEMATQRDRIRHYLETTHAYYDVIDVHCYDTDYMILAEKVRRIVGLGLPQQIWSLECAGPFTSDLISEGDKSRFLVKSIIAASYEGLEAAFWSSLVPTPGWDDEFLKLALVDEIGRETSAFLTYEILSDKLRGCTSIEKILSSKATSYRLLIRDQQDIFVAWSDVGAVEQRLPWNANLITKIPGNLPIGCDPVVVRNRNKQLSYLVGSSPVFVEKIG